MIITGGIDDLWINSKEEIIIVDYKATSKKGSSRPGCRLANRLESYFCETQVSFHIKNISIFSARLNAHVTYVLAASAISR